MKTYKFKINKDKYKAKILEYKGDSIVVEVNNGTYYVEVEHEETKTPKLVRSQKTVATPSLNSKPKAVAGAGSVLAPIPGQIHSLLVKEGDSVQIGDPILILEAMKMESEINATSSGKISKIAVSQGENVQEGQVLVEIGE
ncbi:MAG: biotin/lipoyl-containing protein [Candidatus Cloacimonadales bacterium]